MFRGNNSRVTTAWLANRKAPLQIHSQIMRNVTQFFLPVFHSLPFPTILQQDIMHYDHIKL